VALSKDKALDAAKAILMGPRAAEADRLNRIHEALRPRRPWDAFVPTAQFPIDAPESMKQLARKAESNYLPLLVKTYRQVIKVDGYLSESDEGSPTRGRGGRSTRWTPARRGWSTARSVRRVLRDRTAGHLWARHPGPVDLALLAAGDDRALPGPRGRRVADAGPRCRRQPGLPLRRGDALRVRLEKRPTVRGAPPAGGLDLAAGGRLTYLDAEAHDTGVCPVVRYRDRNLLCGEESLGIVEPLLIINERITEATFQALVTNYFQAFKQRYLIGWVPKSEQEELKSGAGRMWYLDKDPADINIGELAEGTADLEIRNASIRDFAAIGQIPAQALGIDGISNISDATLAGLEAAKNREAGEITTSLGESHEQLLRLCAYIDGNRVWRPTTTTPRSAGATSRPAPSRRRSTVSASWSRCSASTRRSRSRTCPA
jgi:hypothetical protein